MYKSRRRPWVKLYCREWLTSTVRFDLQEVDRSRFIDLLALAGDSKVAGVVCSGYDGAGHIVGYPIDWLASTMRCGIDDLQKSLRKFSDSDRVTISGPEANPVIRISSWKKYQSEYLRQVESFKSRQELQSSLQSGKRSYGSSPQSPASEVEVEGDKRERESSSTPAPADDRLNVQSVKAQIEARREGFHDRETAGQRRLRRNKEAADSVV